MAPVGHLSCLTPKQPREVETAALTLTEEVRKCRADFLVLCLRPHRVNGRSRINPDDCKACAFDQGPRGMEAEEQPLLAPFLILLLGATQAQPGFGDESILSSPSAQGDLRAFSVGSGWLRCSPRVCQATGAVGRRDSLWWSSPSALEAV